MFQIIGYDYKGMPIYGDEYGKAFAPKKEVTVTSKNSNSKKWYESLFDNAGEILEGGASILNSVKGNAPVTQIYQQQSPKNNNNTIIIAVILLVVIIAIMMMIKK